MLGLTILPEDVLLCIVSFLTPPDIIRFRQVSKILYPVTHQPLVWIHAYKSAALPRPPGPFARADDKQALEFIERVLVQSANVEPWSARQFQLAPSRMARRIGNHHWQPKHFTRWGLWFITAVGSSVLYRNLHSENMRTQVLFQLDEASSKIELFTCADTVTLDGHPITYALIRANRDRMTLLKIDGHYGPSLSLESAISLSLPQPWIIMSLIASPRYVCMTGPSIVIGELGLALLDVTTQKIYRSPPLVSAPTPEEHEPFVDDFSQSVEDVRFLLTDTHILALFSISLATGWNPDILIQAYSLPNQDDSDATANDNGVLRMSHEGVCKIFRAPRWALRSNTVTTVGGGSSIDIRLLNYYYTDVGLNDETTFAAIDITLSSSPGCGMGTITLTQLSPLFTCENGINFVDVASSQDGFARGVCSYRYDRDGEGMKQCIQTFSVDASGPLCRGVLGPRVDISMLEQRSRNLVETQFDAWSGRVCYVKETIGVYEFV